ncbi:ribonuclease H protein, partial [Trifolium medium]|nr:ribonuclease H protein [Trifolium medium]
MRVASLSDHQTGMWNHAMLQQLFNAQDIHEIQKIPLNLMHTNDQPIWRCSRRGIYTVRSTYYQLTQVIIDNTHLRVEGNWKKMWKMRVPQKVKLFLWRALRGCLPVRGRLIQKGVQCNNKCPHCEQTEENEWHCFFGCTTVREVWQETDVWHLVRNYIDAASGFIPMIFDMLEEIEEESMAKIVMILWTLWWRRNQKCWNEKTPSVFDVTRRARETRQDWLRVHMKNSSNTRDKNAATSFTWSKPHRGSLKCNIDTACYVEENTYCAGICLGDSHGRFMKAYVRRMVDTPDIAEAEAQ